MIKVVFDSGILVSAFLVKDGISAELLRHAYKGNLIVYLSEEILHETQRVLLEYPHIKDRYHYSKRNVIMFCLGLRKAVHIIIKTPIINVVPTDPNDNMIVACAIKAKAHYIITRDEDILSLKKYKWIKMLTPEELIRIVKSQQMERIRG